MIRSGVRPRDGRSYILGVRAESASEAGEQRYPARVGNCNTAGRLSTWRRLPHLGAAITLSVVHEDCRHDKRPQTGPSLHAPRLSPCPSSARRRVAQPESTYII